MDKQSATVCLRDADRVVSFRAQTATMPNNAPIHVARVGERAVAVRDGFTNQLVARPREAKSLGTIRCERSEGGAVDWVYEPAGQDPPDGDARRDAGR